MSPNWSQFFFFTNFEKEKEDALMHILEKVEKES